MVLMTENSRFVGWAPIHSAASNKQVKSCMMLIEKVIFFVFNDVRFTNRHPSQGANPNALNDDKTPPLHYVARIHPFAEAIPLLELLVKKGLIRSIFDLR
jgi:hypothetical protein